ncbi:Uncharacterised protein [Vibrio cholerae]|nr:Uncharacterised protein [Vibrio cholerae]CSC34120.1 Uncharacterised protein [Vibrio cholerae]
MISKVTTEVRIISKSSGMYSRTLRSTCAPKIAASNTPMMLPRGSIAKPKNSLIPE